MSNTAVVVLCALTLGVTAYVAANLPGGPAAGDDALDARLAALEKQGEAVRAGQAELREAVARVERRLAAAPPARAPSAASSPGTAEAGAGADGTDAAGAAGTGTGDAAAAGAASATAMGEAVAARIERRIEAIAAREHARGQDGKWKAPIDELSGELEIDAAQRAEVVRVLDDGRDRLCALLLRQRTDGKSILDDYGAALRDGKDAGAATQEFLRRLFVEKVPNGDETYVAEAIRIHDGVERELALRLDAARMEKLRALRVDLLDVKTGHDPVGDALRARMQQ